MKKTVFDFLDYRRYLLFYNEYHPNAGRGFKGALAQAINCQPGYISQLFNDSTHLSLEQGDLANRFLNHTAQESDFFLLLIQLARAGSPGLKKYFHEKCQMILKQRSDLKTRVLGPQPLSEDKIALYYSNWVYAFIHVLLTIKNYSTREQIQKAFSLPTERIQEVLDFLLESKLIELKNGKYSCGQNRLHINQDSVFLRKHHQNWRLKAIESLNYHFRDDLHYSACVSLSAEACLQIKEILIRNIEEANVLIEKAPSEELFAFNIDFFKLA